MNPSREKVLVCMPSIDRRIDIGCITGLMQCTDYFERPFMLIGMSNISLSRNEIADFFLTKTQCDWAMWIDSDIAFSRSDWELLWEGDEEVVTAEYAKKVLGSKPAQFGLGFTRTHRSVFEKIAALNNEDGTEHAQRFYMNGRMMINYFPNGANSAGRWISEDHGFFMLAAMTDVKPRVETRTKLRHVGQFEFGYPNQITGYQLVDVPQGSNKKED